MLYFLDVVFAALLLAVMALLGSKPLGQSVRLLVPSAVVVAVHDQGLEVQVEVGVEFVSSMTAWCARMERRLC